MEKIIITGANGFIGRKLVEELSKNFLVYGIVRKIPWNPLENITYLEYDDKELFNKIGSGGIHSIVNLAWNGTYQNRFDLSLQLENIKNNEILFSLIKEKSIKKLYNFSSIMEYELINEFSLNITNKNKYYGLAKLVEDYNLKTWCDENDVNYSSLVITNTFGVGENSTRLVNTIIKKFINGEAMSFSSCEQLYSFIYIDDLVNVVCSLIRNGCTDNKYVIGDKNPRKLKDYILEIYKTLNEIDNKNIWPEFSSQTVVSVKESELNADNTFRDAKVNSIKSIKESIILTFDYIKSNNNI